jgi:hypothetical protein
MRLGGLSSLAYGVGAAWDALTPGTRLLGLTAGVTGLAFAGLSDILKHTVEDAMTFQGEMVTIQISVDGAGQYVNQLGSHIEQMDGNSIFSISQVADAFAMLGMDGQTATDILSGEGQAAIDLAEAMNTDTTPAANMLGQALTMFGASAQQAYQYANILTFMLYNGEKTIDNVTTALNQAGPAAVMLKIPFSDLAIALAFVGEAGLKGSLGASSMNYMLQAMTGTTNKAEQEMTNLGIITINTSNGVLQQLLAALRASGKAGATAADQFDGTWKSLQAVFNEAVKLGVLNTNQTFYEWGLSVGAVNNQLFDAKGNFIGLKQALDTIGQAILKLPPAERLQSIQNMFNIRSSKVAKLILDDIQHFDQKWADLAARLGDTSAQQDAAKWTGTLAGAIKEMQTNVTSLFTNLGMSKVGPLHDLAKGAADFVAKLVALPAPVLTAAESALVFATGFTGIAFALSSGEFACKITKPFFEQTGQDISRVIKPVGDVIGKFMDFGRAVPGALASIPGIFTLCGAEAPPVKAGVSAALSLVLYAARGLRHSGTPERDRSPRRTVPPERARRCAGEAASGETVRGRTTRLARHAGPGPATCPMALLCQPVKPKRPLRVASGGSG